MDAEKQEALKILTRRLDKDKSYLLEKIAAKEGKPNRVLAARITGKPTIIVRGDCLVLRIDAGRGIEFLRTFEIERVLETMSGAILLETLNSLYRLTEKPAA